MTEHADDGTRGTLQPGEISQADYWIFQVDGVEWTYVIQKLIENHLQDVPVTEKPIILGQSLEGHTIFMLRKKFLPVAEIVRVTGLTQETVEKDSPLRLIVSKKDLPEATVPYWGQA